MAEIKVKCGKDVLQLTVDLQSTLGDLKAQLEQMSSIPVGRQKIMGLKGTNNSDASKLIDVGIAPGKTLMLLGSSGEAPQPSGPPGHANSPGAGAKPGTVVSVTPCGLQNIANTCYMNSAIQMVRMITEMRDVLQSRQSDPLLKPLGDLCATMDGARDAVTPMAFWNALLGIHPSFAEVSEEGYPMQHDAQEALSLMLQRLNDGLPPFQRALLSGRFQQTMKCDEEQNGTPTVTDVPFLMLPCNINAEVQTLEAGLEAAFNESITRHSNTLAREASFNLVSRIRALPEYLFVHMVRFSWKSDINKKAKILKPVSFPIYLDLSSLCEAELKKQLEPERAKVAELRDKEFERRRDAKKTGRDDSTVPAKSDGATPTAATSTVMGNTSGYYELCGVISHKGRSADGGHYVFWGKKADTWMVFDDSHVANVSEDDVKRLRGVGEAHIAYVLMYRTRHPITKKPIVPL